MVQIIVLPVDASSFNIDTHCFEVKLSNPLQFIFISKFHSALLNSIFISFILSVLLYLWDISREIIEYYNCILYPRYRSIIALDNILICCNNPTVKSKLKTLMLAIFQFQTILIITIITIK